MSASDSVERFLSTGEHDPRFPGFEGNIVERRRRGTALLKDVLGRIVGWRAQRARRAPRVPTDVPARIRARIRPLVVGLFPAKEVEALVGPLADRVVVVTPNAFAALIADVPLRAAWDIANLLLDDLGAPPLADDTPSLDGLSAAGRAWVPARAVSTDIVFPDVIVHEVAHLTHMLHRSEFGLAGPGPLVAVPPRRSETFAYACEVWAAAERGVATVDALLAESGHHDARVDRRALTALLLRASEGGGWGVIRAWGETRRG
jgi:hypothetical protein